MVQGAEAQTVITAARTEGKRSDVLKSVLKCLKKYDEVGSAVANDTNVVGD